MSSFFQKLTYTEAVRNYIEDHKDDFVLITGDKLKELQSCYLSMLKDIDDFFGRNGIKYCISGGSLLGKMRHDGFIPWDDDIDLTIPREDYEKLKKIYDAGTDPFCQKYDFRGPGFSKGTTVRIAKLYKNDSIMKSVISKENAIEKIYIDLFVIDYVPDNECMKVIRGASSLLLIGILSCVETKENGSNDTNLKLGAGWKAQKSLRLLLGTVFSVIPLDKWYALLDSVTMNTKNNIPSKRITFPTGRIFYFEEMIPASVYYPFRRTEFCGVETWIPNQPEKYLDNRYGDWRKIPDPDKREQHYVKEFNVGE